MILEKEFVPFELALELKWMGFNKECFAFYYKHGNSKREKLLYVPMDDEYDISDYPEYYSRSSKTNTLAPLWQQIFDWFINEKGLLNYIGFEFTDRMGMGAYSFYYVIEHDTNEAFGWEQDGFSTYEEAQLECLKKLIEIVKIEVK